MLAEIPVDLHGYYPTDITGYPYATKGSPLSRIIEQAWEMGDGSIRFIHGHGRGLSPGFVNTNTGYFGVQIRRELRYDGRLRRWIKYTTLDCSDDGSTVVKLKRTRARRELNSMVYFLRDGFKIRKVLLGPCEAARTDRGES